MIMAEAPGQVPSALRRSFYGRYAIQQGHLDKLLRSARRAPWVKMGILAGVRDSRKDPGCTPARSRSGGEPKCGNRDGNQWRGIV